MFFGESMFTRRPDGSKIALVALAAHLARWDFPLVDCQLPTSHLVTLGAREMPRRQFVREVARLAGQPPLASPWTTDPAIVSQLA